MTYASIRTARKSKHWKTRQANAHHAVKLSLSIFALFAAAMTLAHRVPVARGLCRYEQVQHEKPQSTKV